MQLICQPVTTDAEMETYLDIRRKVFVDEKQIPQEREADGQDKSARHFVASLDGDIVATCRVRFMGSAAKIERVAVLKDQRGKGVGQAMMKYILHELKKAAGVTLYKLSAQADAVPFYEKLGFRTHGPEYIDAGMPHYEMVREL